MLTVVTAVYPVTHEWTKLLGNWAIQFDGEVGDAAPGIDLVGGDDGLGWAEIQAGAAVTAVIAERFVDRQREIRIQLPEEKPGSGFAAQQVGMFADPAQAGFFSQRLLHHRCGIHESPVPEWASFLFNAPGKLLQACAHHLVVIASHGIAGNEGGSGVLQQQGRVCLVWPVVHAYTDHADRPRNQFLRAGTFAAMPGHPLHVAVKALVQPSLQVLFGF